MLMKKIVLLIACFAFLNAGAQGYLKETESGYQGKFIPKLQQEDDALHFLVLGDFGRHGQYHQKPVAEQMGAAAITLDIDFTISVGDNFYPNGIESTQDPQLQNSFEDIYTNTKLYENWYVALGNHDYNGNIQAQIDYTKVSRRWQMPDTYYSETFKLKDGSKLLMVVMDTNPFIDGYYKKDNDMYENIIKQDTTAQRKWLAETLEKTDAKWKIVVGHHPLYSGGKRKNSDDTKAFEKKFASFFDKYKVDAYLCGHEHDLQVVKPKGRYTTQFLSGAGSEVRPSGEREGTLFADNQAGFMCFSVTGKKLLVQLVNEHGDIIYTTEMNKK